MLNCPVFIITNIVGFNQITNSFKYLCCNDGHLMNYNDFVVTKQSEYSNYRYNRACSWYRHPILIRTPYPRLKIGKQKKTLNHSFDFLSSFLYFVGDLEWISSLRRKSWNFENAILKISQYSTMYKFDSRTMLNEL